MTTKTLLEALAARYPDFSLTKLRSTVRDGRVSVEGFLVQKTSYLVDDEVEIKILQKKRSIGSGVRVLFEDGHIIVVQKPSGLMSVARDSGAGESVHGVLKEYCRGRVYVVHRLDRETSGVMMFVKTKEALAAFKGIFARHEIQREYRALVEGHLDQDEGKWESDLKEGKDYSVRVVKQGQGERAVTHYQVEYTTKRLSCLHLRLETGKKHQIRVHCKEAGCPVLGDMRYGGKRGERLYLHACRLSFTHPITERVFDFTIPMPQAFGRVLGIFSDASQ